MCKQCELYRKLIAQLIKQGYPYMDVIAKYEQHKTKKHSV